MKLLSTILLVLILALAFTNPSESQMQSKLRMYYTTRCAERFSGVDYTTVEHISVQRSNYLLFSVFNTMTEFSDCHNNEKINKDIYWGIFSNLIKQ